jgi:hypothetical protein
MKKLLLFTTVVLMASTQFFAQTTTIIDANFEQALINLGYDSGPINGTVPTANINTVTSLAVNNQGISDLTGIEDFVALDTLNCYQNCRASYPAGEFCSLFHAFF